MMQPENPIGVFDSGVGGLTVYRALREILPHENFVYFGDTAHLPYGAKSAETVERLTLDAAHMLAARDVKFLVIACNTASAHAVPALQKALPDLPYCGVIAAGAEAAVKASRNGRIAVLATEGTVRSGVYADVIRSLNRDAEVQMLPANVLVSLAEEGWREGREAEAVVGRYLSMLKPGYDTLVLGCTHFPLLLPAFEKTCPPDVAIVDAARGAAQSVAALLAARGLLNAQRGAGGEEFIASDAPERFARLGAMFLGRDITGKVSSLAKGANEVRIGS